MFMFHATELSFNYINMAPWDVNTVSSDKNVWKGADNGLPYCFTEDCRSLFFNVNAVDIVLLVNSSKKSLKRTSTFINSETESDR